MKTPEILAPAGSLSCLKAAVAAGANAVYFGGQAFNARRSAAGFTKEDVKEAAALCRMRGVKTNLTLNTLVKQREWSAFTSYIDEILPLGIDAVIVQDLGVAMAIKERYPQIALHASTQMAVQDLDGVQYLEKLGFERVVLAREVALDEVRYIREHCRAELEVFIHGALCYSYSGRCLMSSFHGGRSGNRGSCAQPCRLAYSACTEAGESLARGHFMNLRDLCAAPHLEALIEAGVSSLKIEGRLKSEAYVAGVTGLYRQLVDSYAETGHVKPPSAQDMQRVAQLFNRGGFTDGYYVDKTGMIEKGSPKHQGIAIGKVARVKRNRVTIQAKMPLHSGDEVEIHNEKMPYPGLRLAASMLEGEKTASFYFKERVQPGDSVWRVVDPALQHQILQQAEDLPTVALHAALQLEPGKPARLEGNGQVVYGPVVEKAERRAVTEAAAERQLSKTGDSGYVMKQLELAIAPDAFVPVSVLNQMRRDLVEKLKHVEPLQVNEKAELPRMKRQEQREEATRIQICLASADQWEALHEIVDERVIALLPRMEGFEKANKEAFLRLAAGRRVVPSLPPVGRQAHLAWIEKEIRAWQALGVNEFEANLMGQVQLIRRLGGQVWAGPYLAVMNQQAAVFWQERANQLVLSTELTAAELGEMDRPENSCYIAYGRIPYMITEQCVYRETHGCRKQPQGHRLVLQDRRQENMMVLSHCRLCYSEILSEKPVYIWNKKRTQLPGVARLWLTVESAAELRILWRAIHENTLPEFATMEGHWEKGVD